MFTFESDLENTVYCIVYFITPCNEAINSLSNVNIIIHRLQDGFQQLTNSVFVS